MLHQPARPMPFAETAHLLRAWLRAPRSVGALAPSGPALAQLMTAQVDRAHARVIELGPGTGVFTRALLRHGLPQRRLVLVEADPVLAGKLAQQHPRVRVLCMDAAALGQAAPLFDEARASTVISGLPLLSLPADKVEAIIAGVFERQLQASGTLYQFTYGLRCPLSAPLRQRLGLQAERIGAAWLNLPPAWVWRIRRRLA